MAGRLAKNVTDEYLTCPVCFQRYKEPRTLPCEHSFCLPCLAGHIDRTRTDSTFLCPIDRAETSLPENNKDPWACAASFDVDPTLAGFLRVVGSDLRRESDIPNFYCFACQKLVTAEAAVAEHRANECECIKLKKAYQRALPSLTGFSNELEKMLRESDRWRAERNGRSGLSESQQEVLQQIELFESKMESFYLDIKEQVSIRKGEVLDYNADQEVEEDGDETEEIREAIRDAYVDLNNALDDEDLPTLMTSLSGMKPKVAYLRKRLSSTLAKRARNCSFEFVPDQKLMELVRSKMRFGTLHSIEHYNFSGQQAQGSCGPVNFYDVAVNERYIVIADGENHVLERFLIDGSFVDSMPLKNPCRINFLGDSEIAVTRFFKKKITVVTLGRKMHVKDHIKTKRSYVGICSLNHDKFACSFYSDDEPSGIDIISKDGKIQNTLHSCTTENGPTPIFVVPMFMKKTSTGNIVICDFSDTRQVFCVSETLVPRWRRCMDSTPCGVACDSGTIYVTLPEDNKVIALDQENGEILRNIVKPSDRVKRPYAASSCGGELVLTEDESDKIHIFRVG